MQFTWAHLPIALLESVMKHTRWKCCCVYQLTGSLSLFAAGDVDQGVACEHGTVQWSTRIISLRGTSGPHKEWSTMPLSTGTPEGVKCNTLTPGMCGNNLKSVIFIPKPFLWSSSLLMALMWVLENLNDDESTLVRVKALCRQATNHYPSQFWSRFISKFGVTRP